MNILSIIILRLVFSNASLKHEQIRKSSWVDCLSTASLKHMSGFQNCLHCLPCEIKVFSCHYALVLYVETPWPLEREVEELGDGKLYTKPSTGRLLVAWDHSRHHQRLPTPVPRPKPNRPTNLQAADQNHKTQGRLIVYKLPVKMIFGYTIQSKYYTVWELY